MKNYQITCLCGKSHQIDWDEEVVCSCGAKLMMRPFGLDKAQPMAQIEEDSAVERIRAGKPVKNMAPKLKWIGGRR